jgi:cytochrome c biogenesis protein CcmG, thiol:disulfide interchange protein DsbE
MTELTQDSTTTPPKPRGGLSLGSIILIIGVVMVIIVFGLQLARQNMTQPTSGPAPQFQMTTYDGQQFSLSDLRGSIVVLNFWASWCVPCRTEAPDLEQVSQTYADRGVRVVGVTYLDTDEDARAFMAEFGMTYINGLDGGSRISDLYRVQAVPETFVIDQQGNVVYFFAGPINLEQLVATLDRLTGAQP